MPKILSRWVRRPLSVRPGLICIERPNSRAGWTDATDEAKAAASGVDPTPRASACRGMRRVPPTISCAGPEGTSFPNKLGRRWIFLRDEIEAVVRGAPGVARAPTQLASRGPANRAPQKSPSGTRERYPRGPPASNEPSSARPSSPCAGPLKKGATGPASLRPAVVCGPDHRRREALLAFGFGW